MSSLSRCPKCQAPFPESLERFGGNFVCLACGQIQKIDEPIPVVASEVPQTRVTTSEVEDDLWNIHQDLPPLDELLTEGWQIFRKRLGLQISTCLLWFGLKLLAQYPARQADHLLKTQQLPPEQEMLVTLGLLIATLAMLAFSTWLDVGYVQFLLKVVRGEPVEKGDLFGGGKFLRRAILCLLVLTLVLAGALFCGLVPLMILHSIVGWIAFLGIPAGLVPAGIVYLMFWPYLYVLIDRDAPGVEALRYAAEITFGNKWSLFGLFSLCFVFWVFGAMALGVGLLVAVPYTFVVTSLAYDRISRVIRKRHSTDASDH